MNDIIGILVGLVLLSLMMWLHELGHYLMGKKLGFKIEEFNIFMGPVLYSFHKNGVKYSLRSIPIGASVQFAGEGDTDPDADTTQAAWASGAEEESGKITSAWGTENSKPISGALDARLFHNRPKRYRAAVLLSGPVMNIISGVLAFVIIFSSLGYVVPQISDLSSDGQAQAAGLEIGDTITEINGTPVRNAMDWNYAYMFINDSQTVGIKYLNADGQEQVAELVPQATSRKMIGISWNPASSAIVVEAVDPQSNEGSPVIKTGDQLIKVNGRTVDVDSVSQAIASAQDSNIKLTVVRDGQEQELTTKARIVEGYNSVGLAFTEKHDFLGTIPYALNFSTSILKMTFSSIGQMISGQLKAKDALSGPVGIVDTISGVVKQEQVDVIEKIMQLLQLFALISLSLGIMNLLPIPLLDGSHLLLLVVEAIRGKRLSQKAQTAITMAGLLIIVGLFAVGLYFDISRIMGR